MTQKLLATKVLLESGWANQVIIEIDNNGLISSLQHCASPQSARAKDFDVTVDGIIDGIVIPGMPNVHSHAFQRAFAGLTESSTNAGDFWAWREQMYRVANALSPQQLEAITAQLYLDSLKAGYTAIGEFHYLHHQTDGKHYHPLSRMSDAIISAAQETGIALTLLPTLYHCSDFNKDSLSVQQQRFYLDPPLFLELFQSLHLRLSENSNTRLGIALHSLRTTRLAQIKGLIADLRQFDSTLPIHLHIAEQVQEVNECRQMFGARPVEYLVDNIEIDERWCLIHASHLSEKELTALAQSEAVIGLCPTTEANLGDGIFPLVSFLNQGGHFAIGSDSHVTLDPAEELKLLEYCQRLQLQKRTVLSNSQVPSIGENLYLQAAKYGAQALGIESGQIAPGKRADLVVLDKDHPLLYNKEDRHLLNSYLFTEGRTLVRDVMVNGQWLIQNRQHPCEDSITQTYKNLSHSPHQ